MLFVGQIKVYGSDQIFITLILCNDKNNNIIVNSVPVPIDCARSLTVIFWHRG